MIKKIIVSLLLAVLSAFPLSAAGAQDRDAAGTQEQPVRIGVMPDAGALPLFLMDSVEPVPFMSARERDTAMQLGELDGMMSDMVAQLNFHNQGINQRILTITESCFQIIGNKDFQEDHLWIVGLSENTIVEFMVDQLIPEEVRENRLEKVAVPRVPVRLEMLRSGKIPLACLTDVMAKALPDEEFTAVRSQEGSGLEPAVLLLSEAFLNASPEAAGRLKDEWNEAVQKINADPDAYRSMLYEKLRLPEDSDYPVPRYRPVTLPPEETSERVQAWFSGKYGIEDLPSYDELVVSGTGE